MKFFFAISLVAPIIIASPIGVADGVLDQTLAPRQTNDPYCKLPGRTLPCLLSGESIV
jgi:hypothetical protein